MSFLPVSFVSFLYSIAIIKSNREREVTNMASSDQDCDSWCSSFIMSDLPNKLKLKNKDI